jgi:hypothetical protein
VTLVTTTKPAPSLAAVLVAGLALLATGCNLPSDSGFVEIKTVPATAPPPSLYLGTVKLAPINKGTAVLRQRIGTSRLETEGFGGQHSLLCEVEVKKNRITTVTLSLAERPPRCQCRNGGASAASNRTCIS